MMGNENLLPKNIRQIGEIQGRQRICLEDYVMTYIRKSENREDGNFLGVFLGERKTAKDTEYVFARGILEVPDLKQAEEEASAPVKEAAGKEKSVTGDVPVEDKNPAAGDVSVEEKNSDGGQMQEGKSTVELSDPWKRLRREQEMYFPGCKILGVCVIGRYPSGRLEELFSHFPEAKCCLYHLQDQEERLYWLEGEKYESVRGYFIFYEQNRRMQEYLEEAFGEKCVEKEGTGDKAIVRFREKVKSKTEERSRSFLKLASSFFVAGVLLAGVIAVNRVADMREAQNFTGDAATGDSSDATGGDAAAADPIGSESLPTAADGTGAEEADASGSAANLESVLAGADAFWADSTEEGESTDESITAISDGTGSDAAENGESTADMAVSEEGESGTAVTEGETSGSVSSDESVSTAAVSEGSSSDTATSEESASYTVAQATEDAAVETSGRQTQATYVIREGDTLAAICAKYYGSLEFLEKLCEANGIEDANLILPGQKIVLP